MSGLLSFLASLKALLDIGGGFRVLFLLAAPRWFDRLHSPTPAAERKRLVSVWSPLHEGPRRA
jgi:hypothetical protein